MPPDLSRIETYEANPTADRVASVSVGVGGVAALGWGHGWGERALGGIAVFLAVARWFGVNKRAVFQTDEFLVLRGSLFSRRLPWADVDTASVEHRGPLYSGLVVTSSGNRKFRPGGVGYFGVRRQDDHPVHQLAAAINQRAATARTARSSSETTGSGQAIRPPAVQ